MYVIKHKNTSTSIPKINIYCLTVQLSIIIAFSIEIIFMTTALSIKVKYIIIKHSKYNSYIFSLHFPCV